MGACVSGVTNDHGGTDMRQVSERYQRSGAGDWKWYTIGTVILRNVIGSVHV